MVQESTNFSIDQTRENSRPGGGMSQRPVVSLDKIDLAILKQLIIDSSKSFKKIATETGLSASAIQYRVNQLVKTGVIERFTVQIDLQKLGYPIETTIGMSVEPQHIDSVASALSHFPEFYSVWIVTGAHNISCRAAFKNQEGLNYAMTRLNRLRGIKEYHLSIATKKKKNMIDIVGLESLVDFAQAKT
jgi:Lrp/AsnC family transcriptional regulator, leucine-responsive regulatory protein